MSTIMSRVSSAGPRQADEERFREFKARRLAKKESDRLKLTAEFPLLFGNKPVGNKVTNTNTSLNKKVSCTPNKRKSTFEDKNDENNGGVANKMTTKPIQSSKPPLSSKKPRKGSMLSPKPVKMQTVGNFANTLPARLEPVAPMEIENQSKQIKIAESPLSSGACLGSTGQTGVEMLEMAPPLRKPLFQDEELENATSSSSRSSLSSLGESIIADATEGGVQEQVMDVLDYLLELDEVDAQTYRRMSSQAFSAKALKRLSMTTKPHSLEGGDVPMEAAYPAKLEDCVIGELDVLNALRNYLSCAGSISDAQMSLAEEDTFSPSEVASAEMEAATGARAGDMEECVPEPTVEYQSLSEDAARLSSSSARSSTSADSVLSDRPQWSDAASACGGSDRSSLDTVTSCPTMRVSFTNSNKHRRQSSLPQPTPSQSQPQCDLPHAEEKTTAEETPLAEAVVVPAEPSAKDSAPAAEPAAAPEVAPTAVAAPAAVVKTVMTYPLAELLDDALMRGLVVSCITRRLDMGNHTKYIVETQILSVPGYAEENSRVRLMCMKRYSDFKTLRANLLEIVEMRRRLDARSSLSGGRSSMESSSGGQDILSIARSRRSSVDPRDSLVFNARDSLCTDPRAEGEGQGESGGFGFGCGRPSELIPPLPSRQVMSMSCASLQTEESFQITREAFLKHWLESVFGRQSCESDEYRLELRKFLTA